MKTVMKKTLFERLAKIQQELKAPKNQFNKFGNYKYRSCEDIMEAVKPLLNGLVLNLTDEVKEATGYMYIEASAMISDGEKMQVTKAQAGINPERKGMDIAQSFGSSSSYARKYALNGLFLIDDTKDADSTNNHDKKEIVKSKISKSRFEEAIVAIQDGRYSKEELKTKFELNPLQSKALEIC
tara:strand:- start:6982 stop:7530 length:549 start_codon:yes stop_codon:yes gene_type:complete